MSYPSLQEIKVSLKPKEKNMCNICGKITVYTYCKNCQIKIAKADNER